MSLLLPDPILCRLVPSHDEARRAVLDLGPSRYFYGESGDVVIPLGHSVPGKLFGVFILGDQRTVNFTLTLEAFRSKVLLQDFSEGQTTHVIHPAASCVFQERNRQLSFSFQEGIVLGFGRLGQNLLRFQLAWETDIWIQHGPLRIFQPTPLAPIARRQEKIIVDGPILFQTPSQCRLTANPWPFRMNCSRTDREEPHHRK